jgi:Putative translation initiation inhibitor, yjgF family
VSTPKGPTLAVFPTTKGEASANGPQILQPSGWPAPKGYANGMAADGRLVVTGGVIGWDHQGHLPADFVAQVRQTLGNISTILAEGGARPDTSFVSPGMSSIWRISGESEGAWPSLSRYLRRALSRHGAAPGGAAG